MNPNTALATTLELRPRETLFTGLSSLDAITGGFPRGAISEITGPDSSGRSTLANTLLAAATARQEICALVDTHGAFDPAAAAASGAALSQILWVRCGGNAELAFKCADALLHAGGFGVVALDLCHLSPRAANRIPLSYWFRFRRAVENTPTILTVLSNAPQAKSCASLLLELHHRNPTWPGAPGFQIFRGMEIAVTPRKPVRPREAAFQACIGL